MTARSSTYWILPTLAHLIVIIAAPFWFIIMMFSFLLFSEGFKQLQMVLFALYWAGPVISVMLLLGLWHALYNQLLRRIKVLSLCLIGVQSVVAIILFSGN